MYKYYGSGGDNHVLYSYRGFCNKYRIPEDVEIVNALKKSFLEGQKDLCICRVLITDIQAQVFFFLVLLDSLNADFNRINKNTPI
jgi:hypothetical protein